MPLLIAFAFRSSSCEVSDDFRELVEFQTITAQTHTNTRARAPPRQHNLVNIAISSLQNAVTLNHDATSIFPNGNADFRSVLRNNE